MRHKKAALYKETQLRRFFELWLRINADKKLRMQ